MDDYSALAYRIAGGVAHVRGCLILSRDGLILGSYPDDETAVKPAWMTFASIGDPERSFVEFGDQVWVYVRRPAYGAFAVADAGVRPGLVIDQLEQILFAAEEARNRRETLRVPESAVAPSGKPRTSLHPSGDRIDVGAGVPATDTRPWARGTSDMLKTKPAGAEHRVTAAAELADVSSGLGQSGDASGPPDGSVTVDAGRPGAATDVVSAIDADTPADAEAPATDAVEDAAATAEPDDAKTQGGKGDGRWGANDGDAEAMDLDADAEVDPVLLAKEFSGLLQVESGVDEASS